MAKTLDKLAKLASFGAGAGAGPAARAEKVSPVRKAAAAAVPLVRNVIFTAEDQVELERLEELLREGGVRRPSIADLVRVALRTAKPGAVEAVEVFRGTKVLDGRTMEGKKKVLGS